MPLSRLHDLLRDHAKSFILRILYIVRMSPNEQSLFDISYLTDSVDYFTEGIERHFESVSRSLKDSWRDSPWLPDYVKPLPPPPTTRRVPRIPPGYYEASRDWLLEHRAVTAAVIAFVGTGAFIIWRRRTSDRAKRRARKAKNGSRTEVIVLAGSPHSPLTRSLSRELERRGFIVYIPVASLSEEQIIQSESKGDIRPLNLDITSVRSLCGTACGKGMLNGNAARFHKRSHLQVYHPHNKTAASHTKGTIPYPALMRLCPRPGTCFTC